VTDAVTTGKKYFIGHKVTPDHHHHHVIIIITTVSIITFKTRALKLLPAT